VGRYLFRNTLTGPIPTGFSSINWVIFDLGENFLTGPMI